MLKFHAHILISRMVELLGVRLADWKDQTDQEWIIKILEDIRESCAGLDLSECLGKATRAIEYVRENFDKPDGIIALADDLRKDIEGALAGRLFLYIKSDRTDLVDNPELFGQSVARAFPSARVDIRDAGNCLAAECPTASVFHLMRVTEHGLRALARDRRIRVPRGPLELATWDEILKELDRAEVEIQQYPKSLAREAQFEFYHGALMEFRRFKNVFRNRIMHTRDDFERTQAYSIFVHVRAFMQILSRRISETTARTPIIWKGAKWTT